MTRQGAFRHPPCCWANTSDEKRSWMDQVFLGLTLSLQRFSDEPWMRARGLSAAGDTGRRLTPR